MHVRRLLRGGQLGHDAAFLLAAQTFYKLSGIVLLAVLSRSVPASTIGMYFFAESFGESMIIIASLQLNLVLMRRAAADPAGAPAHLAEILGVRLVSSVLYLGCVAALAAACARAIWPMIMIIALSTLLENIYFSFGSFFIAVRRAALNVAIGVPVQVLFLSLFLLGMWWHPSLAVLIGSDLLRSLALLVAAGYAAHRWFGGLSVSWDGRLAREGVPFMLLTFLATLRGKLDTVILGFLSGYDAVGRYQLALRIVLASVFLPGVIGQVWFAELAARGSTRATRRAVLGGGAFLLAMGLVAGGVVFVAAAPLTRLLYGADAGGVVPLLRPLALLFPLTFMNVFLTSTMQGLHAETKALELAAVCAGIGLAASCVLIFQFGVIGAVYAQIVSALVQASMQGSWVWRRMTQADGAAVLQSGREDTVLPAAGWQ